MKKEKQGKSLVRKGKGKEGHFKVKYIWSVKEKENLQIFGEENYLILKEKENEGKEKWEIFGGPKSLHSVLKENGNEGRKVLNI